MEHVIAVAMVKDEADIIAETVTHMARQVDRVVVADNGSTDGTRQILERLARTLAVDVLDDPDPAYYQSAKMTHLARVAATMGATWIVPFDADEWWYSPFGRIADVLDEQPHTVSVARAPLFDHVATGHDPDGDPVARMGWRRRDPAPLHKVACRPAAPVIIEQGNHGAHYLTDACDGQLIVRHFPYRSLDQFVSKVRNGAAAYAATDLPTDQGAHWRSYGQILEAHGPAGIDEIFRTWFHVADPTIDVSLIFDPAP